MLFISDFPQSVHCIALVTYLFVLSILKVTGIIVGPTTVHFILFKMIDALGISRMRFNTTCIFEPLLSFQWYRANYHAVFYFHNRIGNELTGKSWHQIKSKIVFTWCICIIWIVLSG